MLCFGASSTIHDLPNRATNATTSYMIWDDSVNNYNQTFGQLRLTLSTNRTFYDGLTVAGNGVADGSIKLWNGAGTFGVTFGIDPGLSADTNLSFPSILRSAIENTIITNLTIINLTNNYAYITNLTVETNYVDLSHVKNAYITNLYLQAWTTNYYLFSTNLYISNTVNNTYVSNYFYTNAFLDTYISNYFNTNVYNYVTNLYHFSTNLTVTNFFLTDNYVSNYFMTNIFVTDNDVSNFFTTNIYNTINISSNYFYEYSMNMTNPVFFGNVWVDGYAGNPNPKLTILSPNNYFIVLDGETGDISASGINADVFRPLEWTWDGPTNSMDMWTQDQYYKTFTPCEITGFTDKPDYGHGWGGLLTITNASSTNILLTFPSGIIIPERTNQVCISNASQGMLSIKFSHQSGTNGVYRQF